MINSTILSVQNCNDIRAMVRNERTNGFDFYINLLMSQYEREERLIEGDQAVAIVLAFALFCWSETEA